MATTGFWPIKGSLKDLIKYADNPDKTTNPKYLDDDLAKALEYVENDDKTDMKMFVTGINCITVRAYEEMMATKRHFGKTGGNVAYHGYQTAVSLTNRCLKMLSLINPIKNSIGWRKTVR